MRITRNAFSRAIGVTSSTVCNWENRGLSVPDFITPTGRIFYTEEQVERYLRGEDFRPERLREEDSNA